jgi:hypothetical protein
MSKLNSVLTDNTNISNTAGKKPFLQNLSMLVKKGSTVVKDKVKLLNQK